MNIEVLRKLDLEEVDISPDVPLLEEGGHSTKVYILVSGKVKISSKGHELAQVDDVGTVLGEISALLGTTNVATVMTIEKSTFFVVENFQEFVLEHPEVAVSVAQVLAVRLINMNNHLVHVKDELSGLQTSLQNYLPVFPESMEQLKG
jgi:CRP-like cAMP-binding protein